MLDVQKERFRQLMASAILDLWKKETGSLASVFIEATVCITSCNSRMTVIQLSDHFPGLIPEPPRAERTVRVGCEGPKSTAGRPSLQLAGQKRKLVEDCVHRRKQPDMVGGGGGITASRDVIARHHQQQQQRHLLTDSNNNPTVDVDDDDEEEGDGDFSEETDREDEDSSEESEDEVEDRRRSTSGDATSGTVGLVIPGNGLVYTHAKPSTTMADKAKTAGDDSAIQDMSTGSLVIDMSLNDNDGDDRCNNNSSVDSKYRTSEVVGSSHPTGQRTNGVSSGVDPTQHDADLLISSPHNYTEQVRDVIRSRLLNGKSKTKFAGDFFQMPLSGSTPKSFEVSSPALEGLTRPFDMNAAWSLIKREKPNVVMDGRIFQQHFSPSSAAAAAALHLMPPRKSFMMDAVGSSADSHPPSLQQLFGIANGGSLDPSESKVFPTEPSKVGTVTEPDEISESRSGLAHAFNDQKVGKFDGVVSPDGNTSTTNNEQKTYRCGFCQKTFLFKSKYHEHLPVHTSARPFECHMCTRTYKYKYDLRVHLRTHLGIPTKSTICPFCSGKFLTNKLLRNHIKEAHREQQQITEEQCAQSLDNVAALSPSVSSV